MPNHPLKIGLTGGIGAGKSTVAALFQGLRVPVIDTDALARELVAPGLPAYQEVVAAFGKKILATDKTLNRDALRQIIFSDPPSKTKLETILHPRIRAAAIEQANRTVAPYCVIAVPLLLETNFKEVVSRVLVVDCEESIQVERVMKRNRLSENEIRAILQTQLQRDLRLKQADDVIENTGDLKTLEAKVAQLHLKYLALSQKQN